MGTPSGGTAKGFDSDRPTYYRGGEPASYELPYYIRDAAAY